MSMEKLTISIPKIIESIIIYFVLRWRKSRYGFPFRKIKLIQSNPKAKSIYALVDPEDFRKLNRFKWFLYKRKTKKFYAATLDLENVLYMHRLVMAAPPRQIVDHKDRNGLNNTKQNLRFATPSQNASNRERGPNGSSKYKGVIPRKNNYFEAYIFCNGKYKYLGRFKSEEDAAKAYDKAAKELFGEFAVLNFPQEAKSLSEK